MKTVYGTFLSVHMALGTIGLSELVGQENNVSVSLATEPKQQDLTKSFQVNETPVFGSVDFHAKECLYNVVRCLPL